MNSYAQWFQIPRGNRGTQSRFNPGVPRLAKHPVAPYQGPWGRSVEPTEHRHPHEPSEPIHPHEPVNDKTTRGSIRSKISTFLSKGGHV